MFLRIEGNREGKSTGKMSTHQWLDVSDTRRERVRGGEGQEEKGGYSLCTKVYQ